MEFIDSHCHIQSAGAAAGEPSTRDIWAKDSSLTGDVMIERAAAAGVTKLICVGCDHADSQLAIAFAQSRAGCWASIGIHPHETKKYARDQAKLDQFAALATEAKVVAIGECGLDYFYGHSPRDDQIAVLKFQIELAMKHDLPMIFHVRAAFDDFWPIFDAYHHGSQKIRGVLHSFTDNQTNLERAIAAGLYVGVNGIATFAKDPAQIEVYRAIPLGNLLLETDAPFLTPTPYRGSINEPLQVFTVAKFLADLQRTDLSALATATTANAQSLFGI
ncbi:MAG: TatD family hydrolase [Candidatus Saccharibacteria bacterium]